ncbi:hypothetical protein [Nonomuraea sp. JJY05]|uniref:hypothetical protein n=1 Tax=Nonomuraea sp. JJY05 TaxID=3350255 RepID=UPI00373E15A8
MLDWHAWARRIDGFTGSTPSEMLKEITEAVVAVLEDFDNSGAYKSPRALFCAMSFEGTGGLSVSDQPLSTS